MSFENMVFVVTGATSGIGAATAEVAARRGARVVVAGRRADEGEEVAQRIRASGGEAVFQRCDVTSEDEIGRLMDRAAKEFGGIDVLVNNAGVAEAQFAERRDLEGMSVDDFRRVVDVNLIGTWLCAKYAFPHLKDSRNPSIVNAGSSASFVASPGLAAYCASKAAISMLTQSLALELSPFGIRCNCYCPHTIRTPMLDDLFSKTPDPEAYAARHVRTALVRRYGTPEEVAELICFLASDEAGYVNGVSIPIDGGTLAWRGAFDPPQTES
jgi:NAD(P)-dependent dehydrogenase (short-subunit alcohol dehydrogenase family)